MNPAITPRFEGVRILVIEDHDDSRDAMRLLLESLGAHVLLARDGREGLDMMAMVPPDVTLCDLRMPGVDGFTFMERVRADSRLVRSKVIAITAYGELADILRTWSAGFDGHLVKPVDHDVLIAALERALRARCPTATRPRRLRRTGQP